MRYPLKLGSKQKLGALGLAVALSACAPAPAVSVEHPLAARLTTTEVEVVLTSLEIDAPEASDAEPRYTAELVRTTGERRGIERPVLGAVSFNAGAAVLELDRRLVFERLDGGQITIAEGVSAPPTSSPDHSRLAYALRSEADFLDVFVHDGSTAVRVAEALASAGAFQFSEDGRTLAFIAAENGGIAGAWVVASDGRSAPRCVTSCGLGTGDGMIIGGGAGPLGAADLLDVRAGRLEWRDETGTVHEAEWAVAP